MKRKPTLDDVAELAGVSKTAVSMILNEKKGVTFLDETIRKVQDAADELGYVKKAPKKQTQNLFVRNMIMVMTPNITSPYYATLAQSIEQEADKYDIQVVIQNTYRDRRKESEYLTQIKGTNLYGIICAMTPQNVKLLEEISETIPVVIINDKSDEADLDTVEINNYSAGVLLARHLIDLGHKHIAYITSTLSTRNSSRIKRLEGITDAYRKSCPDGNVFVLKKSITPQEEMANINFEYQTGYELALEAIAHKEVTGLIAGNDMIAYGIMDALHENSYSIPEDYSLCGFDNLFPSRLKRISLTTVEHYIVNKGKNAVEMIRNRHTKSDSSFSSTKILFKHKLIVRNSTGKPKDRSSEL